MYRCAKRVMGIKQRRMKTYYDKKRRSDPLNIGDMVYVFNPRTKRVKLEPNWRGPFEVINKSKHLYLIEIMNGEKTVYSGFQEIDYVGVTPKK